MSNFQAATTSTPSPEQIRSNPPVVLRGVTWQTYKYLMADVGSELTSQRWRYRAWRIAYSRGVLEIKMPLTEHEEVKGLLESFVEAIADELKIEVRKL